MLENLRKSYADKRTSRGIEINNREVNDMVFAGLKADGVKFEKTNQCKVDFSQAKWRNCRISDSNLKDVNFQDATLRMCEFNNAQVRDCNFTSARFEDSVAQGCQFDGSSFVNASLTNSDFSRSRFVEADLTGADATFTNMRGADFRDAILINTDFRDADLRGADFSGAKLSNTNFKGADIRGAIFDPSVIEEESQETEAAFSPQMQELADSVGPLVASLIKKGSDVDVFSEDTQQKLLKDLEEIVKQPEDVEQSQQGADKIINSILQRAGSTGIDSLLDALRDDKGTPSDAVAGMLEGLFKDLELNDNATTEELLAKLIKSLE